MNVNTGLPPLGEVPWGTHYCHFFRDETDLCETLVPFFKAGLENNEACLWITAAPFCKEAALAQLRVHVSDVDERIRNGQLALFDHGEWYERHTGRSRPEIVGMWLEAKQQALAKGYRGLRLSGNTAFLRADDWEDFRQYENAVRQAFRAHEILGLCSYKADTWGADAVLDIVQCHDFTLARRRGDWEVIENASVKCSKAALVALNTQLEQRVEQRTHALAEALEQQRLLTAELSHRVKNMIASVQSIVDQTLRRQSSPEEARKIVFGRLSALARAHDQLSVAGWHGVSLDDVVRAAAAPLPQNVRINVSDRRVTPRAALNLALVFHELTTNAARYGALSTESGVVTIDTVDDADCVVLLWRERGGPAPATSRPMGFGTLLIRQLVMHDLRGECELAFEHAGLTCKISVPRNELLATAPCLHPGGH